MTTLYPGVFNPAQVLTIQSWISAGFHVWTGPEKRTFDVTHPLPGRTALVVDDEFLIGAMIEEILSSQGVTVFLATHDAEASAYLRDNHIDFALIDYKLHDSSTESLSARLAESGVPFAFCTGSMAEEMQRRFPGIMVIPKPFSESAILEVASALVAGE